MGMLSGDDSDAEQLRDSIARKERRIWYLQTQQIPAIRQRIVELRVELGLLEDKIQKKKQVAKILKLIKKAGNGNE